MLIYSVLQILKKKKKNIEIHYTFVNVHENDGRTENATRRRELRRRVTTKYL